MQPISIQQIAEIVEGRFQDAAADLSGEVSGVTIDSRTAGMGQLFVAIAGENFDGHDYIAAAFEKGAVCAIAQRAAEMPGPVIIVDDTIAALGRLAAWYRQQLSAEVIAITGSAGKTTTRQIMHQVLSGFYRCRQAPKSFNNNIGVPLTVLSAEADDELLLLELGSNHPGEIAELTAIARPNRAVVTFIGPAHLAGFGTIENILKEKASIALGLTENGRLYVNGDQPELVEYVKNTYDVDLTTFGETGKCDIIGTGLETIGSVGTLTIEGQCIQVPLSGRAVLINILTVWSVCRDLKVSLSDFSEIIGRLKPVSMRMEVKKANSLTILNDCYNASPASMANALETLRSFRTGGNRRLVFIAGAMGELGDASAQLHYELGQKAAAESVDILLVSGEFSADVLMGVVQSERKALVQAFENTAQLCDNLHKYIQPDDIVLVKGSRLAGLERAVQRLEELYG